MLSLQKINDTISDLEMSDTNLNVMEALAHCVTVRNHLLGKDVSQFTRTMEGSEFLEAASNVDVKPLLGIINEHLEAVRIVYPKEYNDIVERVRALKRH